MSKKYCKIEHIKLLSNIIKRMADNHMKWLMMLFTIIAFNITINKFLFDINNFELKLTLISSATILILLIEIITIFTSWKFFNLENIYRKKQGEVIKNMWSEFDLIPKLKKNIKINHKYFKFLNWEKSWIINVGFGLIAINFIINIGLIISILFF